MSDTIVALATPMGRSGIGVVRASGEDALAITRSLIGDQAFQPTARRTYLRTLVDTSTGNVIDEALITYFRGPRSFTGEDVVEISAHGSPVVLRQILDAWLTSGARLAGPGEFSLRALSNGRISLAEAEAIRDLIDAQTRASARQAIRQLDGELSRQLQPLKDELLNAIVILESALEFVEDDLPEMQVAQVREALARTAAEAGRLASTFRAGRLLREGIRVALAGRPNVGKSSLFNRLIGSERAIVTDIPGTTRDHIHERYTIGDIPISLIDTAGLRETTDTVESIGVARSRAVMVDADVLLVLVDGSEGIIHEDIEIIRSLRDMEAILVINKTDVMPAPAVGDIVRDLDVKLPVAAVSAKTGDGIEDLERAIISPFAASDTFAGDGFLVSDARHHDLLSRASD
jgi:tRNA modification GTPase